MSVDAADRRSNVVGELSRLVHRAGHDAQQVLTIGGSGEPIAFAAFPLSRRKRRAGRVVVQRREHADAAIELAIGQTQPLRHAVPLEDLVPALHAGLAVPDIPVAKHLVHRGAHRDGLALEAAVRRDVQLVNDLGRVVIVPLLFLGAALEAVAESTTRRWWRFRFRAGRGSG